MQIRLEGSVATQTTASASYFNLALPMDDDEPTATRIAILGAREIITTTNKTNPPSHQRLRQH
jgi:hypothetical protein